MQANKDEKKFRCYYIGCDGNTPVCRKLLLTRLDKLIPAIGDNEHCETPLWYQKDGEDAILYAQLSDEVALITTGYCILSPFVIEQMTTTDADIDARIEEHVREDANDPNHHYTQEQLCNVRKRYEEIFDDDKRKRDEELSRMHLLQNYTKLLLDGAWITDTALRAYEEVGSPYLPVLQELRRQRLEQRKQEEAERKERQRKQEEEEQRKKAEAEAKEQQRLTGEAEKFKRGEKIKGEDVVELCRRYGIKVHLRTIHNLQQVVYMIDTQSAMLYSGCKAKLTGSFKACDELYDYLQTHKIA